MKLLLCLLFSVSVLANVGMYAEYKIDYAGAKGTIKKELTSFDKDTRIYTETTTTKLAGRTTTETAEVDEATILSKATLQYIYSQCSVAGGTQVTVKVAAGSLKACKVDYGSEVVHVGVVPFQLIKMEANNMTMELKSYKF